jgi:hypothetical protein
VPHAPRTDVARLVDIPNVGRATAGDFVRLGITRPGDLVGQDAYALHARLEALTGVRQDPCVIDVFLAAIDYMAGAPAAPWWRYTPVRKAYLAAARSTTD